MLRVTEVVVERLEVTDPEPLLVVPLLCTSTVLGRETKRVLLSLTRGDDVERDEPEEDTLGLLCVWRGGLNACRDLLLLSVRLTTGCRGAGELTWGLETGAGRLAAGGAEAVLGASTREGGVCGLLADLS